MHSIKDAELIIVINKPPCNIESPDFDISDKNLIIIDTENNNPSRWVNCRVLWLGIHWTIVLSIPAGGHDNCEKVIIRLREVPAKKNIAIKREANCVKSLGLEYIKRSQRRTNDKTLTEKKMNIKQIKRDIDTYLDEVAEIATLLIDREKIVEFAQEIVAVRNNGGRLFFIGVGGSAGNCSHAVNDFRKILGIESYAITDNVSELTARINDEGWDTCFSKWLECSKISGKDAIVVFSVGGGTETTSYNIIKAIEYAKEQNTKVLSIVSRDGGYSLDHSDVCILIPVINKTRVTPHAEEWQGIIWHLIVSVLHEISI